MSMVVDATAERSSSGLVPPDSEVGPGRPAAPEATLGEHFGALFFTLWTLFGLGLDGWAHMTRPELESFFTPWHAVFYAGFTGSVSWLAWMVIRRRPSAPSLRAAIPEGYQLAAVGLGLFAIGGVADSIWHTLLGIETSIDALLSPPHLLLLVGSLGGSSAPARAAWRAATGRRFSSSASMLPAMASIGVTVSGLGFFFLYANGLDPWQMTVDFVPGENEIYAAQGVLSTMATTVLLVGATLLAFRRWSPPVGGFTILFAIFAVFMTGLDAFSHWWQIIPALAGGLTADLIVARRPDDVASERARTARLLGLAVPLVIWIGATILVAWFWGIGWPPELWAGQIVLAALAGLGLSLLSHPPAIPTPSDSTPSDSAGVAAGR